MQITKHDQRVLSKILGTEKTDEVRIDASLPPDPRIPTHRVLELTKREKKAIELESQFPEQAMTIINEIIWEEPMYASAYNNRAQLRRTNTISAEVVKDLETAVKLALPETSSISPAQANVLRSAYCQLAAVYLAQAKQNTAKAWDLKIKASEMMNEASKYGEPVGAALAQSINPYANLTSSAVDAMLPK